MQKRISADWLVLPRGNNSELACIQAGRRVRSIPLSYSITSKFFIFENYLVIIVRHGKRIVIDRIEEKAAVRLLQFDSSRKGTFHAALITKGILFVGGRVDKEAMWSVDLESESPKLRPIALPDEVRGAGKTIDDFIVSGNQLIAVDDLVFPKYFLEYDISTPTHAACIATHEFEAGTSEQVIIASGTDNYFVVLSSSVGMSGSTCKLSLYRPKDCKCVSNIEQHRALRTLRDESYDGREGGRWRWVEIFQDWVIITAEDRIGFIYLKGFINDSPVIQWHEAVHFAPKHFKRILQAVPVDSELFVLFENEYDFVLNSFSYCKVRFML